MKRLFVSLVAALVACVGLAGTTAAASNGATHTFFTATYPVGGATWTCAGVRLVNHGIGTRDKEACLITGDLTGYSPGTFSSDPSLTGTLADCPAPAGVGFAFNFETCWGSDLDGALATSWTQTFARNHTHPASFTFVITAFYNP
jgi:hypothetical protein